MRTKTRPPTYVHFLSAALILVGLFVSTHAAYAVDKFMNPLGNITLYDFLLLILNALIYILFPIIVMMIVYTGFLFVAAQGNPAKLEAARKALIWTVIGALIVLGSKALALAISATVKSIQGP
jgi:hypothetical protein